MLVTSFNLSAYLSSLIYQYKIISWVAITFYLIIVQQQTICTISGATHWILHIQEIITSPLSPHSANHVFFLASLLSFASHPLSPCMHHSTRMYTHGQYWHPNDKGRQVLPSLSTPLPYNPWVSCYRTELCT